MLHSWQSAEVSQWKIHIHCTVFPDIYRHGYY